MANDNQIYVARIESNTRKLSGDSVHQTLSDMVKGITDDTEGFLKGIVPHGSTLALSEAVGSHGPVDVGIEFLAEIGIPAIMDSTSIYNPGSMLYPIYVDKGTGIYGNNASAIYPFRANYMKLPPDGIHSIYQKSVKGQKGQHYMAATYAAMRLVTLPYWKEKFKAILKLRLQPDSLR
jgi:hypothetical protein